jgi:hypothetical protein
MTSEQACWAQALGGCGEKISREHHVSERILKVLKNVTVQGFPWCHEPKQVGIGSLTAKHLCKKHNSALSKTDDAAGCLFEAVGDQFGAAEASAAQTKTLSITLNHLERWFLKTAINFRTAGEPSMLWPTDYGDGRVPARLVKIAFGRTNFKKPSGLYFYTRPNHILSSENQINIKALSEADNVVRGFIWRFRGLIVLLWLYDKAPAEMIKRFPDNLMNEHFMYRPKVLKLTPTEAPGGLRVIFE